MWKKFTESKLVFRLVVISDIVLVTGCIAYAAMANITDGIYPFGALSEAEGFRRMELLAARDSVLAVTIGAYLIGQIVCGCAVIWKKLQIIDAKSCLLYYASQLLLASICVAPFALMSERSIYDYVQPVLSIAGNLALIVLIFYFSFRTKMRVNEIIEAK